MKSEVPIQGGPQRMVDPDRDRVAEIAGVCGGLPCVAGTRIPVWILAADKRGGKSDGEILESYPSLSAADLAAVWKYVDDHSTLIEKQIHDAQKEFDW